MLIKKGIEAFSDGAGAAKTIGTSLTYGDGGDLSNGWQSETDQDTRVVVSFEIASGTPTTIKAQVETSPDSGTTNRGPLHCVNFISGGVIDVDDAQWDLPVGSGKHQFEFTVRSGYAWRVGWIRTGTTVGVLAYADQSAPENA